MSFDIGDAVKRWRKVIVPEEYSLNELRGPVGTKLSYRRAWNPTLLDCLFADKICAGCPTYEITESLKPFGTKGGCTMPYAVQLLVDAGELPSDHAIRKLLGIESLEDM